MRASVVTIHGWHLTGVEMWPLRRRLQRHGFEVHAFRYRSRRETPEQAARCLRVFLERIPGEVIHLVAHSLGGMVVRHLFALAPVQRPGRIVMLGAPLAGSRSAARMAGTRAGRWWLGAALDRGLVGGSPALQGRRIGMIAGNRGLGVGSLLPGTLPRPNDGTVAVDETYGPEVVHHLEVPYGHFRLLLAGPVADAVVRFLEQGEF
ncbi:probableacetyltransferase/hydrolase [Thioalkalivibrio nitratireducens DSM 14787]|uniref:Probableacetyltransferase/hydrolase n=1 Tax=Thioalkalivibrio nitratireducens (strain DSM 14787 / UNIQEM 213 / ALEN2) TaxID=1255043 RepID=L0DZJ0_THIND|nr:alpha/beta fold hydrolase [Thioalkalivibrio nitratireducens]AGA35014.1 probableacetyltransferase/hydrolase [Thioalkalivibrio nitratireducens DSM 14787]